MKKLFLYIIIIISVLAIFFSGYFLSKNYFRKNCYRVEVKEDFVLTTREYNREPDEYNVNFSSEREALFTGKNNTGDETEKYTLGFAQGFVVVYSGNSAEVYEYTDISQDRLKILYFDIYESLEDMEFDTREEVFKFLESIDS